MVYLFNDKYNLPTLSLKPKFLGSITILERGAFDRKKKKKKEETLSVEIKKFVHSLEK